MQNRLAQINAIFLRVSINKDSAVLSCIFVCNRRGSVPSASVLVAKILKREVFACCDTLQINPFSVLRCFLMLQQFSLVAVRNTGTG